MTAQTILPANSVTGGYEVANSCRFDDGSSTQMNKTISSTSTTWTFSCWIKLNPTGTNQYLASWDMGGGEALGIGIEASTNQLFIYTTSTGQSPKLYDGKLRDPSAWMNIVIKNSSGTITSYINGTQAKTSITGTALASGTLRIGCYTGSNYFYDGYMSEVVLIDGTAYSADSFGEFDSDSNIWKPIDVSGLTFGSDGFYLDFEASGNLGNDANGGTDLTEVNLAATDQATDTCTNNFATMNPLDNFYAGGTFAEGNLQVTTRDTGYSYNTATFGVATGKWYWEVKWSAQNTGSTNQVVIGIAKRNVVSTTVWLGSVAWTFAYEGSSGHVKVSDGNATNSTSTTYSVGDIISVALDLDNNKIHFAKNGTYTNSSDAAGNSGGVTITAADSTSGDSGFYFPAFGDGNNNLVQTGQFNFGAGPPYAISSGNADADGHGNFEFAVPSGYFAICTKNLAEYG